MPSIDFWLEKATLDTAALSGGAPERGGLLSPEQTTAFFRKLMESSRLIGEARNEISNNPTFEVPTISMASRALRPLVEGTRLVAADRTAPTTGIVRMNTYGFKAEVPITDEVYEDNIERERLASTIMQMLAERVGADVEEISLKSDTARNPGGGEDATLDQFDGVIKQLQANLPAAQKLNATNYRSYESLFHDMVAVLPARFRRNYSGLRIYVSVAVRDAYIRELTARGTTLGDTALVQNLAQNLSYRGIPIHELPLMDGDDTINGAAVDYAKFAFLCDPQNLMYGWHRRVRIEQFRDPREGVTSFIPSLRFDVKWIDQDFGVLASNVPTSL